MPADEPTLFDGLPDPVPEPQPKYPKRNPQDPRKYRTEQRAATLADPNRKLSSRQELFVQEYVRSADVVKAAEYSGVEAERGRLWLRHPRFVHVQLAIDKANQQKRAEAQVDARKIVNELARVAFFNPKDLLDNDGNLLNLRDIPDSVAVSIKKFRVSQRVGIDLSGQPTKIRVTEIEFWNKLDALKQLAQHLGLLKDVTTNVNILSLDWAALLGRKDRSAADQQDPLEAKIAAASRQPASVSMPGNALPGSDVVDATPRPTPGLPCALRELEVKEE